MLSKSVLRVARIAQMHLRVDQAGEDRQPTAVDRLGGLGAGEVAQRGDPPVAHADIGPFHAPGQDAVAPPQHEIEACHGQDSPQVGVAVSHPAGVPKR